MGVYTFAVFLDKFSHLQTSNIHSDEIQTCTVYVKDTTMSTGIQSGGGVKQRTTQVFYYGVIVLLNEEAILFISVNTTTNKMYVFVVLLKVTNVSYSELRVILVALCCE